MNSVEENFWAELPETATNSLQKSKKIIDVVIGSIALFPASLIHHTIPFESEEERILLAFDVAPKFAQQRIISPLGKSWLH